MQHKVTQTDLNNLFSELPEADQNSRNLRAERGQGHKFYALEILRLLLQHGYMTAVPSADTSLTALHARTSGVHFSVSGAAMRDVWLAAQLPGTFEEWVNELPILIVGEDAPAAASDGPKAEGIDSRSN